jgi:hypothetical protein
MWFSWLGLDCERVVTFWNGASRDANVPCCFDLIRRVRGSQAARARRGAHGWGLAACAKAVRFFSSRRIRELSLS